VTIHSSSFSRSISIKEKKFYNIDFCSTDLEDVPAPVFENDHFSFENFVQVEKKCRFERIWTVSDESNSTKAVFQFLRLDAPILFEDFSQTFSIDCDDKSGQEILEIFRSKLPKVKAACFEDHLPIEWSVDNDVSEFTCPGKCLKQFSDTPHFQLCYDVDVIWTRGSSNP